MNVMEVRAYIVDISRLESSLLNPVFHEILGNSLYTGSTITPLCTGDFQMYNL